MPETTATTYPSNFLTNVLLRIDLSTLLSVQDNIKDFQSRIKEVFPILEPVEQKGLVVNANSDGGLQIQNPVKITWQFKSKDKNLECHIDESVLIVVSKKYDNYQAYRSVLDLVLSSFFEVYPDVATKRIGFRYINEIKVPDSISLVDCLSPWVYRDDTFFQEGHAKLRGMSKYEISLNSADKLSFSFGVFNSRYPESAVNNEFVLDYDCYTQEQIDTQESLLEKVDNYNQVMTEYFEKSITDTFRSLMNPGT